MKTKYTFFTSILLIILIYGCQKQVTYPEYFGTYRSNSKIVLQPNGVYQLFFSDTLQVFKDSKSTYKIFERNDTTWLYVTWRKLPQIDGSKVKETWKYALMKNGDYLTMISYH